MLRALDVLGRFKWPSLVLTLAAPLISYPYWMPVQQPYTLLRTASLSGIDIDIYGQRTGGGTELRIVSRDRAISEFESLDVALLAEQCALVPLVTREEYGATRTHIAATQRAPVIRLQISDRATSDASKVETVVALDLSKI